MCVTIAGSRRLSGKHRFAPEVSMATALGPKNVELERKRWLYVLEQLVGQVETWANAHKWAVHRDVKKIQESRLGSYGAPLLSVMTPSGRIRGAGGSRHRQGRRAGGSGRVAFANTNVADPRWGHLEDKNRFGR